MMTNDERRTNDMETAYWRDRSGETYVVTTDDEGRVVAAAGPLHHSEHDAVLRDGYDPDPEVTEAIAADPDAYTLHEPR